MYCLGTYNGSSYQYSFIIYWTQIEVMHFRESIQEIMNDEFGDEIFAILPLPTFCSCTLLLNRKFIFLTRTPYGRRFGNKVQIFTLDVLERY
uniref:Uncharacterized protein n=1 Tax=Oryza brachyantha TaxID=4533 RepID=J3MVV3_ORYBR